MIISLKHGAQQIELGKLNKKDVDASFANCIENDMQILDWIHQFNFDPNPELDEKLMQLKDVIQKYYLNALIGINDLGVVNVANRTLMYKVQLMDFLTEAIRKNGKYEI